MSLSADIAAEHTRRASGIVAAAWGKMMGFLDSVSGAVSRAVDGLSTRHGGKVSGGEDADGDVPVPGPTDGVSGPDVPKDPADVLGEATSQYEQQVASYSQVPTPEVDGDGRVQDVLSMMRIESTFTVPNQVLLPEDFEEGHPTFPVETPVGYDRSSVDQFTDSCRRSITTLYDLLVQRNDDVAKLATCVDKLTVEMNNLRFQSAAEQGVTILPSSSSEQLENDNSTLRAEVGRLSAELSAARGLSAPTGGEVSRLRDAVTMKDRQIDQLTSQLAELSTHVAYVDEQVHGDGGDGDEMMPQLGAESHPSGDVAEMFGSGGGGLFTPPEGGEDPLADDLASGPEGPEEGGQLR